MRAVLRTIVAIILVTLPWAYAHAAEMTPIVQKAQTAHYRLVLQVGPMEKMYSKAEVAKMHPTSGEVMAGGAMSMAESMAMDMRHLEVQVISRATGKVVTNAKVSITVTNTATKKSTELPVATMYGVKEGPSDWHYGNNLSMSPGSYTVLVALNGEHRVFVVTIPKM